MRRVEDNDEIIQRVAAIDVGKAELVVCVRVPDPGRAGHRQQEIIHSSTLTHGCSGWLTGFASWE